MRIERWKLAAFVLSVLSLLALAFPSRTDLGWGYLTQRDYARAREMFTAELRGDPSDLETWLGLADVYEALGDPDRHIETLEGAARRFPAQQRILLRLAEVYEWNKDPDGALRTLERLAVAANADAIRPLQRLLKLYDWVGRYEEELSVLRRLLALRPSDPEVVEDVVSVARTLDRQEEAIPVIEAFAARRPSDPQAQRWLAELYDSVGQPERALPLWKTVARLLPDDVAARNRLLSPPGDAVAEEIAQLERARSADPRDEAARLRLVEIYRGLRDAPRAIPVQQELVALKPGDHDRLVLLGRLLVQEDRAREAIPLYERAAAAAPGRVETVLALAQLYEWTNQPREALGALERLLATRPADRALGERVAVAAQAAGETDRALAALDRLRREFPGEARYLQESADLLVAADRTAEAIPRQRQVVALRSGAVEPALRLAQLYEWTRREGEAIGVYEGLDRAGVLPEAALVRLSDLYRFQDRPADFLRVAERLLARRPQEEGLRGLAADAAAGLRRYDQALRLLRPVVERRPGDEALVVRYLVLAIETGQPDEGLRVHRRLLASATGPTAGYRTRVARALTDMGRYREAIAEYESLVEGAARPVDASALVGARLSLAQLYDWTGAPERALAQWEEVARDRPKDPDALRQVGRRSLALSRSDTSLQAYRSLLAIVPDDPEGLKRAGQLLAWDGRDPQGARRLLERFARTRGGDYEVHYLLGELYTAARDDERARAEYEKALRLLPARSQRK